MVAPGKCLMPCCAVARACAPIYMALSESRIPSALFCIAKDREYRAVACTACVLLPGNGICHPLLACDRYRVRVLFRNVPLISSTHCPGTVFSGALARISSTAMGR